MKRSLSLLTIFCIMLALFPLGHTMADTDATLLFDMKIEGVDESGNPVITDESGANLVENIDTEGHSEAGSTDNALTYTEDDLGIKYLTFASYDGSKAINRGSGVNVMFKDSVADILSNHTITFEAWARPKNTDKAWGVMATVGYSKSNTNTNNGGQKIQFRLKQSAVIDPRLNPDKMSEDTGRKIEYEGINNPTVGEWCHFVVTRKLDATTEKWVSELYINGNKINCTPGEDSATKLTDSLTYRLLTIGNTNSIGGADRAFMGDVGDFKVYEGALTAEQAQAKYYSEKETYGLSNSDSTIVPSPESSSVPGTDSDSDIENDILPDDALVFDMCLDGSVVDGELVITDESNANASKSINVLGHPDLNGENGTSPVYKEENGIQYLEFASYNDATLSNRRSQVNVEFSSGLSDKKAITIEAWARPNVSAHTGATWSMLASIGPSYSHKVSGNVREKAHFRFTHEKKIALFPDRQIDGNASISLGSFANYNNWAHYVITREYDAATTTWTSTIYINGIHIASENMILEKSASGNDSWLAIGGSTGNQVDRSFIGDIADFKLYTYARTAGQIENAYFAELGRFYELVSAEHNLDKLTEQDDTFTISFDGVVDIDTVDNDICIKNSKNELISTMFDSYDSVQRKATFKIMDTLDGGEEYTLYLTKIRDMSGLPLKQAKITFKAKGSDDDIVVLSKTATLENGTASISMSIEKKPDENKKYILAMVIYDAEGRIIKMIKDESTSADTYESNVNLCISSEDSGVVINTGFKVKAIAWSVNQGTGAIALTTPIELM